MVKQRPRPWDDESYMAGTEGTGEFEVFLDLSTADGRVGYRDLGNGNVRIRLEPVDDQAVDAMRRRLPKLSGWKQPDDGQFRFSTVVPVSEMLETALDAAYALDSVAPIFEDAPVTQQGPRRLLKVVVLLGSIVGAVVVWLRLRA